MLRRYLVDSIESNVVYFAARHFRTSTEFTRGLEELLSDNSLPSACRLIIDLTEADYSPTANEVRDIAASIAMSRCNQVERLVGIVVSNMLQYGLARMLDSYLDNLRVSTVIFRSREEALASLSKRAD
jgi:hypothetical protein